MKWTGLSLPSLSNRISLLLSQGIYKNNHKNRSSLSSLVFLCNYSISSSDYDRISNDTLESLYEALEALGDKERIPGYDVELSNGVLTIKIGSFGTFVINRQPPNKQIWLSSPISGPKRYDYKEGQWIHNRTIEEGKVENLHQLLNRELGQIFSKRMNIFKDNDNHNKNL